MISETKYIIKIGKRKSILLIAGILTLCLLLFFQQKAIQNKEADLPEILKRGRLTVVTDDSNSGFAMHNDSAYGFEYEIIKAFADSLGVELQITRQNDIKKAIESLKNGEYDIVAKFIPNTAESRRGVTLTKPLLKTRQMLVQRKKQDLDSLTGYISTQYELGNDTVFLPSNSFHKKRIENLMREIADTIFIVELAGISAEAMVALVAEKKIPRTVCAEILTNRYQKIYPNLDFSLPAGFTQEQCWAVNTHAPHLARMLNNFLADFQGSMAYWELYRKYY
jgi:membrane-bound lytic murein transglycosylase MltF